MTSSDHDHDDDECPCNEEMLEGFSYEDEVPVMAFDPRRRTNAALVADLVTLGFLHNGQRIIDLTYGRRGAFWKRWRPTSLVTNDLAPKVEADWHFDFADPPGELFEAFDVVVYDPPYGYRGTSQLESDKDYGIDEYMPPDDRDRLILDGIDGCNAVCRPGGLILVKCQDQTVSGEKRFQTKMIPKYAATYFRWKLTMELHVFSHRKQPAGRDQKLVHQNFSTGMLFRRGS